LDGCLPFLFQAIVGRDVREGTIKDIKECQKKKSNTSLVSTHVNGSNQKTHVNGNQVVSANYVVEIGIVEVDYIGDIFSAYSY
jgi:hypothetical protein